jgi:hypothetical protein
LNIAAPAQGWEQLSRTPLLLGIVNFNIKEVFMDYTFLANLQQEFTLPDRGILSRLLHKDERVNVTLFGFAAG